jgi:hypothetical protein
MKSVTQNFVYSKEFNPDDTLEIQIGKTVRFAFAAMPITHSSSKCGSLWHGVTQHSDTMTGIQVSGQKPETG